MSSVKGTSAISASFKFWHAKRIVGSKQHSHIFVENNHLHFTHEAELVEGQQAQAQIGEAELPGRTRCKTQRRCLHSKF
jgi:hypothetical protein